MNLTPTKVIKQLSDFWKRQSTKTKSIMIVSASVFLIFSIIAAVLLNIDNMVILYRGLSETEAAEIMTRLDQMSVNAESENGTIRVPKQDEAMLKMQLSSEGYPKSTLNYDVFTSNTDFMTTDYEKKKYMVFQLQNRLQDAIMTLQGVNNAIVTISVADESSFVLETDKIPSSASVVLNLKQGTELSNSQVKGIEELVSKSVPGLETKNVVILDSGGEILRSTADTEAGGAYSRMELTNSVNRQIEDKIKTLLEPVFGRGGVSVAVNATINFNKKVSESRTYSPVVDGNGVVIREDQSSQNSQDGGAAGGAAGTASNTGIDTYTGAAPGAGSTSDSSTSSREYLVSQLTESVQNDGGEITDLSIAVMINSKALTDAEIQTYRELIAYGAGIDTDNVVVSNVEFTATNSLLNPQNQTDATQLPMIYIAVPAGGLLLALLAFLFLTRKRKPKKKKGKKGKKGENGEEADDFPDLKNGIKSGEESALSEEQQLVGEIVLNETREQALKREIRDFSSTNPEIVAQLIRTWMKEDENDG